MPPVSDSSLSSLRSLTTDITSHSAKALLPLLPNLRFPIHSLTPLLQSTPISGSQHAILLQRLLSRITSLLSDARHLEARLAGTVFVKGIISGSPRNLSGPLTPEMLSKWIRQLLSNASRRNDAFYIRSMTIMTAFAGLEKARSSTNERMLSSELVPLYWSTTIELLRGSNLEDRDVKDKEMIALIVETWTNFLLAKNPGTARPFAGKIRDVLDQYASFPGRARRSDHIHWEENVSKSAVRAFVALHAVEKAGERDEGCIKSIKAVRDLVDPILNSISSGDVDEITKLPNVDVLCEGLLLVTAYISTPTPASGTAFKLPVGSIVALGSQLSMLNKESIKSFPVELKDSLIAIYLPQIHLIVLQMLHTLVLRLETLVIPCIWDIIKCVLSVFNENILLFDLRIASYNLLSIALPVLGDLSTHDVRSIDVLIHSCCSDILGDSENAAEFKSNGTAQNSTSIIATPQAVQAETTSFVTPVAREASSLLPILLRYIRSPRSTRSVLERAAVISNNADALLAATLNPMIDGASLLPFAVNVDKGKDLLGLEALIRPRMPVLHTPVETNHGPSEGDAEVENELIEKEADEDDNLMGFDEAKSRMFGIELEAEEEDDNVGEEKLLFQPPTLKLPESFGKRSSEPESMEITSPKRTRFEHSSVMTGIIQTDSTLSQGNQMSNSVVKTAIEEKSSEEDDDDFTIPSLVLASRKPDD